jgi:catechol 2,3-dioxygenase-like lactoylglutathione lyase family enzyme
VKANLFFALLLASAVGAGTAAAQPAPFNQTGVTMGHWHLISKDVEANKKLAQAWYAKTFGGKVGTRNNAPVVDLPGVQIRFARADTKQAPTRHRVLDHIGFDVKDQAAFVRKLEAEGIKLDEPVRKSAAGNTITYITDPWGTRIEIVQRAPLGPAVQ